MIIVENVNKYFNKHKKNQIHVINNTSMKLEDSGLVSILGSSGSGKTTLLNAIGGLDKVNSGKIYINDKKITRRLVSKVDEIRNLNIGYIFQNYNLINNMSVYDNIALVLKMIGIKDKKEIKTRVDYVLEKVGMYRYRNRLAEMLSGGERQRVGIARAIVKNPSIIIADEPTGNLDSKNTIEIMNIIKSISKDKLVILVTHEKELAYFYASRIIEVKDGVIISDDLNNHENELDYRIDNKIYLKDLDNHIKLNDDNYNIDIYSENKNKINLEIVIKNGNIYFKSNNDNNKLEVLDNNSNIEFVDDHYKKITKDEYLKYKFDSDKLVNRGKLKYTSILNPFTLLINGFKKVFNYPFLKKILLVGFFVSAMFILYSISNIFGIINIKDEKFIQQNKDYLLIKSKKTNVDDYLKYELDENVKYLIPGNSIVSFKLTYNNFYQTSITSDYLKGSLSSIEMIKQNEIINGRMPENNHEIVVDKASVDSMFKKQLALQAGIKNIEDLIGKEVEIPNMPKFKIVGIVDKKSPSIYTSKDQFINIVANSISQNEEIINADMLDFKLMEGKFELRKGRLPENDYEVIVNIKNINEMKLNKQIKNTVNGRKLLVVGYYFDKYDSDVLLVNNNTIKYKVINNKSDIIVYTNKKEEVIKSFQAQDLNIQDIYTNNKTDYINKQKPVIMATLIMGGVILTISFVEILLIIRASFLSRVKEIGIYRAIGVKKKDIYKMFMGEIIAITTIASLPGYFFMAFVISKISTILIFKDQYLINPLVLILSIIIIYGFNIVVGLIPVFNTLRKTPAEILSRSDID